MIGLVAYLALVVTLPALVLGHQGQHWPLRGVWRTVRALMARRAPSVRATRALGRAVALVSGGKLPAPPEALHANPPRTTPTWARKDAA